MGSEMCIRDRSMTGTRGMQSLLPGVVRNYLPGDWQQLGGSIQNMSTTYPALAASVRSLVSGNAILSGAELSALSPSGQQRIQNVRTLVAMSQAMARNAVPVPSRATAARREKTGLLDG